MIMVLDFKNIGFSFHSLEKKKMLKLRDRLVGSQTSYAWPNQHTASASPFRPHDKSTHSPRRSLVHPRTKPSPSPTAAAAMAHQNPTPFVYLDAAAAADARRRGMDPHVLEQTTQDLLKFLYMCLPDTPVYAGAALSALPASSGDADDQISALPFGLLRNIVSRLPAKDAAHTSVLSRRWRPVSRCTPLALADAHLLPGVLEGFRQPARADTPALAATVSRAVAAHPGPFRAVHLVCGYYADAARQRELARWVQTFAAKGVEELVLVNRPWLLDMPLPAALLDIATLTRLYLGLWKFPGTSALPHPNRGAAAVFPHLRELVLCSMEVESRDMEYLLAGSPVLENLGIVGARKNVTRLRLVGQHLRCVQICLSAIDSVAVVDTPSLERLFLWETMVLDGSCARLRIGKAPKLRVLGYLNPGIHMLEIRNTVINVHTIPTCCVAISSFALHV